MCATARRGRTGSPQRGMLYKPCTCTLHPTHSIGSWHVRRSSTRCVQLETSHPERLWQSSFPVQRQQSLALIWAGVQAFHSDTGVVRGTASCVVCSQSCSWRCDYFAGTGQAALETTTDQDRTSRRRPERVILLYARQCRGFCVHCYEQATCLANNISCSVVLLSAAQSIQTGTALRECERPAFAKECLPSG